MGVESTGQAKKRGMLPVGRFTLFGTIHACQTVARPINFSIDGTEGVDLRLTEGAQVSDRVTACNDLMDDVELVERAKDGQPSAYAQLVRKYEHRVFNTCWRICGHHEDARDVTQEAFIKAYENLHSFRRQSAFYTWLFRVAVNLALSHRRSSARRRTVSLDETTASSGTQADRLLRRVQDDSAGDQSEAERQAQAQALIARALNTLDDDHRAVIVLRDMEGFDYGQIGEMLEIPTGTVKSRLHRARLTLRAAIAPALGFDE